MPLAARVWLRGRQFAVLAILACIAAQERIRLVPDNTNHIEASDLATTYPECQGLIRTMSDGPVFHARLRMSKAGEFGFLANVWNILTCFPALSFQTWCTGSVAPFVSPLASA